MAFLNSREADVVVQDGFQDYDVPPPAVSVRQVEQFMREKDLEAAIKSKASSLSGTYGVFIPVGLVRTALHKGEHYLLAQLIVNFGGP